MDHTKPFSILMIVTPDFNLAATTAFIDPFRAANYLEGRTLFRWQLVSMSGGCWRPAMVSRLKRHR